MYRFECDYTEGAHPLVMKALCETNLLQTRGYGNDIYCDKAKELIKNECKSENAEVHFLVGGTQTNTTVIAAALRPHEGVICAGTGHINVHETGAIEATGHKVLALYSEDGRISAEQIDEYCKAHFDDADFEHIVKPGMVYLSNPTENGTLYLKNELSEIKKICEKHSLYLYIDGARMGYGLASPINDLTLSDYARLCDVFYIGGTKCGTLFGEAVVIVNDSLKKDFRYIIKQHGGMFAKGRLLGIQFLTLFENGLYYEISKAAVDKAMKIRNAFADSGCEFLFDSHTNQQFPILDNKTLSMLSQKYTYGFWKKIDENRSAVRFCTSWATTDEAVNELIKTINEQKKTIGE